MASDETILLMNNQPKKVVKNGPSPGTDVKKKEKVPEICDHPHDFESIIEQRMHDLETLKSESDSDFGDDDGLPVKKLSDENVRAASKRTERTSSESSSVSDVDDDINVEAYLQPASLVLPFGERRRLSECVEEDEEDDAHAILNGTKLSPRYPKPALPPPLSDKKVSAVVVVTNGKSVAKTSTETPPNHPNEVAKSRFKVTPAADLPQPRIEAAPLRHWNAAHNSKTISFPCSAYTSQGKSSIRTMFLPESQFPNPHLDRRFFDTSIVEIRQDSESSPSLDLDSVDGRKFFGTKDEVWIKRSDDDRKQKSVTVIVSS